jgi:hypothetical protein
VVDADPDREHQHDPDQSDPHRCQHPPGHEYPRRQGRAPQPLEDALLTRDRYRDRQRGERGRDRRVDRHRRGQELRHPHALPVVDRLVAEQRAEDQQEHQRERDGEERRHRGAPEGSVGVTGLPEQQRGGRRPPRRHGGRTQRRRRLSHGRRHPPARCLAASR